MLSKCAILQNNMRLVIFQSASRCFQKQCPHKASAVSAIASANADDWKNARRFEELPGPSKWELARGFMIGGEFYKKPVKDFFTTLQKRYGDFLLLPGMFGTKPLILAFDPNMFREVFRNEGIWPVRRNFDSSLYFRTVYRKDYFQGIEGLIMTSGESWGKFRSAVNPVLLQPRNVKLYLNKMIPVNEEFLQRIREIRDPKTHEMPDNFVDDINRLAFESIAVIALDQQLGLIRTNRDASEPVALFRSIREFFDLAFELDVQPSIWKIIKTPTFYKMMRVSETMFQITKKYIEDALERIEKNPNKDSDYQKSVVEALAEKNKLFAIVMAMDMMLAGVDTTTTSMTGILLGIATNPEKQEKLRSEIRSILPQKNSVPTVESMKNLPYLRACIKEGIRMYPFGPGTTRSLPKDMVLNGYQIPKDTDVAMANNIILRESKYFPKPDDFIPERWLRSEEGDAFKADEVNPFVYLPFGFGPRSCAGKRIVELEMELTIMRLVRNFQIEFNYSIENAFNSGQFITSPAIPLKFKLTELPN